MDRIIRKITVGNYKARDSMHFQVGNSVGLSGGDVKHQIHRIKFLDREYHMAGTKSYEIHILDVTTEEVKLWKTISIGRNEPVFVEYDTNF